MVASASGMWYPKWACVGLFAVLSFLSWDLQCSIRDAVKLQMRSLTDAAALFRIYEGRWPTRAEGLDVLTRPGRRGKPIIERVPDDPWGRPYEWVRTPGGGRVVSRGPDRVLGTVDDVDPSSGRDYPSPPESWPTLWILLLLFGLLPSKAVFPSHIVHRDEERARSNPRLARAIRTRPAPPAPRRTAVADDIAIGVGSAREITH